jgi:hypothetical protein
MARKLTPSEELAFSQSSQPKGSVEERKSCSLHQLQQAMLQDSIESKAAPGLPEDPFWDELAQEDWF